MSVHYEPDRRRFVVRWREDGRQRSKRFRTEQEAVEFDANASGPGRAPAEHALPTGAARDGVYAYSTGDGVRYRFAFRQSDGSISTRRGFTSRSAAVAARRRLVESIDRGEVKVARDASETFWDRFVADKRAYMTAGSHLDLVTHGRKRLVPFFGSDRLSRIDADRVREWVSAMLKLVEAGERAPTSRMPPRAPRQRSSLRAAARLGVQPSDDDERSFASRQPGGTSAQFTRKGKVARRVPICRQTVTAVHRRCIGRRHVGGAVAPRARGGQG